MAQLECKIYFAALLLQLECKIYFAAANLNINVLYSIGKGYISEQLSVSRKKFRSAKMVAKKSVMPFLNFNLSWLEYTLRLEATRDQLEFELEFKLEFDLEFKLEFDLEFKL